MKRKQKMKVLVLSMFAMVLALVVPKVNATGLYPYDNGTLNKEDADIVLGLKSDKTELAPGDHFTLTFSLDKIPAGGVGGISFKLAYDKDSFKVDTYEVKETFIPDLKKGDVGIALGMGTAGESVVDDLKTLAIGMAVDAYGATEVPGVIFTVGMTVTDTVNAGKLNIFMVRDDIGTGPSIENVAGLAASGVKKVDGRYVTDDSKTIYLDTNLDKMQAVIEPTEVKFTKDNINLDLVEQPTYNLVDLLQIKPEAASTNVVSWASTNDQIAMVDNNGTVTAKAKGECDITATVGKLQASIHVTVSVAPTNVTFSNKEPITLDATKHESASIKDRVKIEPAEASDVALTWESDNEGVATVSDGVVTAVGKGTCNVTVKYGSLSDTMQVNVIASVSGVTFVKDTVALDMESKTSETVGYTIAPENADVTGTPTIVVDDEEVATATVDAGAKTVTVNAVGYGETKATLTVDGKTAVLNIKVTVPLKSISIDKTSVTIYKGEEDVVTVTAEPEGSAWETLDAAVKSGSGVTAKADKDTGKVTFTGLERGTAVVSIYANGDESGDLMKDVNVTVKENRITALTIKGSGEELLRGKTEQLETTLTYEEDENTHPTTDDKTITWSSEDENIATVDQNGVVTGVHEGTTKIKAVLNGSQDKVEAEYSITVVEHPFERVVVSDENKDTLAGGLDLSTGDEVSIPFGIEPEDCTDTKEEIEEKVKDRIEYDTNLFDLEVSYDPTTKEGVMKFKAKGEGQGNVDVLLGSEEGEDGEMVEDRLSFTISVSAPPPAEDEENSATSDIPVAPIVALMVVSIAGIVVSKKVLVK